MLYRKVPKTGDELSILGYGCMRFPQKNGRIDYEYTKELLVHAMESGINYLDTAWGYHNGQSEEVVGKILEETGSRDRVRIATKLPHWLASSREDMDGYLDKQLKRLRTGHIDYYLIHDLTKGGWEKIKTMGFADFLDKAKKDGRITYAGFSFHDDIETFKEIVDGYDWDFCQIQYNLIDTTNQAGTEGLEYAASKNLAVMIMEPLRGGNLARIQPAEVGKIWEEAKTRRTPAEWALRWLWNRPEVTVVLSGMTETDQLDENLRIAEEGLPGSLTEEELELAKRAGEKYREIMKVGCTGCSYCMPCPFGVNIPACFEIYNSYHMFDDKRHEKFMYMSRLGGLLNKKSAASLCRNCGRCVKACPQHIDIPNELKKVKNDMEGPVMKIIVPVSRIYVPLRKKLDLLRKR
ncbi:aldo/keto reductase [Methanolacinia petrolearia DSM 11571]|uniref:Aldo/keto reductase n=1 Tax=Methanolacinia petrolearia (strain DSM 11571 / OCM 486 / SEBR 4847) TaxID=679926 RepID=E1RDC9_METP4|nr:aldo/keto reductase [Methanolacinia petrolearia]ADN34813.1 aldo/keto reductase [Methanolacinia petrolearia DSM 11571]